MNKCIQALLVPWLCLICADALAQAQWVAHASIPGPNTPAIGQSRFDQLFLGAGQRYRIPYPFGDLVAFLESRVDNGSAGGVRQVFVPKGRSLQRDAPAPDFFRLPRAVIALQGEPLANAPVLEYRLFIAHQPATDTLEIISYNDDAGRFEFQVVEDYAAGRQPRVRQANRVMCLSCHQNAAPIFPMRPWSETSFNVEIATRLTRALPQRFRSLVGTLTADAGVIDLLVERANYLAAAQFVWQRGCAGARCRAAALRALLQYRLSAAANFGRRHPGYRRDYYSELQRSWQSTWPDGLALGNSRIVDRDPLTDTILSRAQDALSLRPAHAIWRELDAIVADGIILRLAGFLSAADIRRIDAHLLAAGRRDAAVERLRGSCRLAQVAASARLLECVGAASAPELRATIEVEYGDAGPRSLHLLSLRMPGDPDILQPASVGLSRRENAIRVELANSEDGLSTRLASGDRLAALELSWQDDALRGQIDLEIELVRDFQLLERALAKLLQTQRETGSDSLSARPFRREAVMRELGQALGMPAPAGAEASASTRQAPNPDLASLDVSVAAGNGSLALLQSFCGRCHASDTRMPPGFLFGADAAGRVRQCAPRILARLAAWQVADADAIVPMPPPATVAANWHHGEHYRRLTDEISGLLPATQDAAIMWRANAADYASLPPCLAAEQ